LSGAVHKLLGKKKGLNPEPETLNTNPETPNELETGNSKMKLKT